MPPKKAAAPRSPQKKKPASPRKRARSPDSDYGYAGESESEYGESPIPTPRPRKRAKAPGPATPVLKPTQESEEGRKSPAKRRGRAPKEKTPGTSPVRRKPKEPVVKDFASEPDVSYSPKPRRPGRPKKGEGEKKAPSDESAPGPSPPSSRPFSPLSRSPSLSPDTIARLLAEPYPTGIPKFKRPVSIAMKTTLAEHLLYDPESYLIRRTAQKKTRRQRKEVKLVTVEQLRMKEMHGFEFRILRARMRARNDKVEAERWPGLPGKNEDGSQAASQGGDGSEMAK